MITVSISQNLKRCCPQLALGIINCDICNSKTNDEMWQEIAIATQKIKETYSLENIKTQSQILATREAYKRTGKDPNRYRPSAEALYRRILRNIPLYRISAAVDLINLLSIETGFSIGGFDTNMVQGSVCAGIGETDESIDAIGRGQLNITGLPVLRDAIGVIGTPTSDVVRTSLQMDTKKLFININAYNGKTALLPAMQRAIELLEKYLFAKKMETCVVE